MADGPGLGPEEGLRSGFVALIGRPNSGKSTLVNALVGEKVAIVSERPQTTRHRLRAILDRPSSQLVFVDTPGLHKPEDALGEELNRSALMGVSDVDVVCFVLDATAAVGRGDEWVARHVRGADASAVLIVTKTDLATEAVVAERLAEGAALAEFDAAFAVSALEGVGLDVLVRGLEDLLPEGPRYFPPDMVTDQPLEVMVAELIREKVLWHTREEVPHAVGVAVDELSYERKKDLTTVRALVFVERESQKGIVVGRGGAMVKRVGTEAREDLEHLLEGKVFLDLRVRVKKDWRRDPTQIRRFGYGEGL